MDKLFRRPQPKNWKTGKVSLSYEEAAELRVGIPLVVEYEGRCEYLHVCKRVEQWMIDSLDFRDDYVLMPFVNRLKPF